MDNTHYKYSSTFVRTVNEIISQQMSVELSDEAKINIQKCRDFLDKKWRLTEPIYGINTGFGSLCNVKISNENLSKLQENLVKSHACGTGRSAKGDRN
jgi:histidine ammonia-lyase